MANKTEITKRIEKKNGSEIVKITNNGKYFSMKRDNFGNMSVSLGYTSEDKTNNFQDYFEVEAGKRITNAFDSLFGSSKEDMVFFDTINGNLVLSKQDGSYRFIFMKEFNEGANEIEIKLARDEDSYENELMNRLFDSLAEKKGKKISISNDDVKLVMVKSDSHTISFSIQSKKDDGPVEKTFFTVKKGDSLYDKIFNSFISFGGDVHFDICNGELILQQHLSNGNEEFVFSYERWQNSDPSNGSSFNTNIFDNTLENQALFGLFDSINSRKYNHDVVKDGKTTEFKIEKIKRISAA